MTRRAMASEHSRLRGFTLIEVLVALVIVAVGVAALLGSLNSAANSTAYLRDKAFAQWIAVNRITETRLATTPPANGKSEGEIDYAGQRWQWRQVVSATQFPTLRRIDVSVRPASAAPAASSTTEGDEGGDWTFTLSGSLGSSVAFATGSDPSWEPAAPGSGGGTRPPGATANGATPAGTPAPVTGSAT